jgi:hypothetical protein
MTYHFDELKHTKIADLRGIAAGVDHPALQGYTQFRKEQLLDALVAALGIEKHEHHEVKGLDKGKVKAQIRQLKAQRDEAEKAHDHDKLKQVRQRIRGLKRAIRKATV